MVTLTTGKIVDYVQATANAKTRMILSYPDIASSIRTNVENGQLGVLEKFVHSFFSLRRNLKPDESYRECIVGAYKQAALYAFLADNPTRSLATYDELCDAYSDETSIGPSMKAMIYLFDRSDVDLIDVFDEEIDFYWIKPRIN